MKISVTQELLIFAAMILSGIAHGFLFDFFRVIRKLLFKKKTAQNFIDILYWIFAGALFFVSILYFNDGELRLFIFVGIGLGLIFYFLLLTNSINFLLWWLFSKILKIFQLIFKILLTPATFLYKIIIGFFISFFKCSTKKLKCRRVLKKFHVPKLRIKNDKKEK